MKDLDQDRASTALTDDAFLAGLARGQVLYSCCADCNEALPYGAKICPHCGSTHLKWVESTGKGRLRSYVIYHRSYVPGVKAPYAVGVFQLEEGPRLLAPLELSGKERPNRGAEFAAKTSNGQLTFR